MVRDLKSFNVLSMVHERLGLASFAILSRLHTSVVCTHTCEQSLHLVFSLRSFPSHCIPPPKFLSPKS